MTDQEQVRVRDDELVFDEHGRATWDGKPFTGVAWESPSGDMFMSEVQYQDGLDHGVSVDWYEEGRMASRQMNRYATKHGTEEEWYRDGTRRLFATWDNGVRVKLARWDAAGALVEEWELPLDHAQRKLGRDLQAGVQAMGAEVAEGGSGSSDPE